MAQTSAANSVNAALSGLVVLDLTRVLAGPYATMVLADLGAQIIKVEPPGGDDARHFSPFADGKSSYFASLNRGKQSIMLDLKASDERATFEKLVRKADILVENYRADAMQKLGYGWEALHALNRRLIYAAISGFGHTGPYRNRAAYDLAVQGMGGIMSITGQAGQPPVRVGTSIGDITAGLFGICGILAALQQRERSGQGCMVDVGMLDCQVAILEHAIGRHLSAASAADETAIPAPTGMRHPSITPFDGFKVADEYLIIAAGNDVLFHKLCVALGHPQWAECEQFHTNARRSEHHAELKREIEAALAGKNVCEWLQILQSAGVPCAPINNIAQVVDDEHINARNMIINTLDAQGNGHRMAGNPIKMSGVADPSTRNAAPQLDQHRAEILRLIE